MVYSKYADSVVLLSLLQKAVNCREQLGLAHAFAPESALLGGMVYGLV